MGYFKGIGPNKLGCGTKSAAKSYNDSMTKASKYGAMLGANIDKGMSPKEAGKQAAIDIKNSAATQTRAEIKASKLEKKANQAVKDDKMNKNEKLVTRHNKFVKRKGLDKDSIAYG